MTQLILLGEIAFVDGINCVGEILSEVEMNNEVCIHNNNLEIWG
jgi:hypothetical protein